MVTLAWARLGGGRRPGPARPRAPPPLLSPDHTLPDRNDDTITSLHQHQHGHILPIKSHGPDQDNITQGEAGDVPGVGSGPSSAKSVWQPEVRSWDQEHSQVGSLLSVIMNQKIPSDSIEWYGSAPTSAPARDPEGCRGPRRQSQSQSPGPGLGGSLRRLICPLNF